MIQRFLLIAIIFHAHFVFAQEAPRIILPSYPQWSQLREGLTVTFDLKVVGKNCEKFRFSIPQGKLEGMAFDSLGRFTWTPSYDLVDRLDSYKFHQVIFEAKCEPTNETLSEKVELRIQHINRKPIIRELKPFYVQFNTSNIYKIDKDFAFDEDNDPIVFIPSIETLPEGMKLNSDGSITWSPSFAQFRKLKEKPLYIDFFIEDQPHKQQSKGKLKIETTQMDLPPLITVVPKENVVRARENQTINLRFYLSDPNGDDDIQVFDFLADNPAIPKNTLIRNTPNQYEFIWQPNYDFVKDPQDSASVNINFFVLDKTQKREVKSIKFIIKNTINEAETDQKNYTLYRGTLQRGWELLEQLKEKEEELKKSYNKAKKGKKNRSVLNAGLGATTGLSSVITQKSENQRIISTIGGTTVLTIGTLEATEVVGRSMKDLIDRLNYVIEKKNEIQTKGDIFSRDFSLKATRRNPDFLRKVDDFMSSMNLKGLVALELDATWEPTLKATDANLKKTFKDFNAE
jgi:hypothetical protein